MEKETFNMLTKKGKKALEEEYKLLINIERPKVIKEIAESRSQGDLSENAEFNSAREKQGQIEDRIKELENIIENSKIISQRKTTDKIRIGSTFIIKDLRNNQEQTLTIVGSQETNPFENRISDESALAKAAMGSKVGDEVIVYVKKKYKIKIVKII